MEDTRIHWVEFQGRSHHFHEITEVTLESELELVNSCNGLLCVYQRKTSSNDQFLFISEEFLHILNPITGDYITLPPADEQRHCYYVCGLGFSNKTKQFKVVKICHKRNTYFDLDAEVCTIGTGIWRNIGDVTSCNQDWIWCSYDSFVNGCFHWVAVSMHRWTRTQICAFDFETEQFRSISLPGRKYDPIYDHISIGVFEETIFSCCIKEYMEVWLMKESGVVESWTKILVLEKMYPEIHLRFWNPVVLENGEILLSSKDGVFLYNPIKKSYSRSDTKNASCIVVHKPSFCSLKDIWGDGSKVLNVRSRHRTR